jgi:ABC-type oligopeptide transport system substrate-binding subunit
MALYHQAERLLIEEAVVLPLAYMQVHLLQKPWVKNYPISRQKRPYWKDFIIEPH